MSEPSTAGSRAALLLRALCVAAVALGVGVIVGLTGGRGGGGAGSGSAPTVPVWPSTTDHDVTPSVTPPPPGLSAAETRLWRALPMGGVHAAGCAPYPAGERSFVGVEASLSCPIVDPSMEQRIIYYRFDGAEGLQAYLEERARGVDRTGDCAAGAEQVTRWNAPGHADVGSLVCVDTTKGGTTYFKMVFTWDGSSVAAVIQDESPSDTVTWWTSHAAEQF